MPVTRRRSLTTSCCSRLIPRKCDCTTRSLARQEPTCWPPPCRTRTRASTPWHWCGLRSSPPTWTPRRFLTWSLAFCRLPTQSEEGVKDAAHVARVLHNHLLKVEELLKLPEELLLRDAAHQVVGQHHLHRAQPDYVIQKEALSQAHLHHCDVGDEI